MSEKSYHRSFAGGEIAPELYARLDLTKHQTGLATCLNFKVLPHGPASNRPGWEYTIETKDSTKESVLLPFIFSVSQSYVLEFGDQYMRIHTGGGTVLSAAQNITGITQANPGVLTYSGADPANGSWVYLTGILGMTQLNGRYVKVTDVNTGANTFEIADIHGGADLDTTTYTAYSSGGTMSPVYEITSPYLEADLFDLHFTQSNDVLTIVHPTYQQRHLSRLAAASWTLATFTLAPTIGTPAAPGVVATGAGAISYSYVTTAVASDGLEEGLQSAATAVNNDITIAGQYNTITPAAVTGAVRYNVYRLISGLYGYIGQTDGSGFKDTNFQPDVTETPPLSSDPFVGATNYPGAVGYYQGRRWFAGTPLKPQNVWGTRSGTESNLSYSIPTQDDDSIKARLTARQANTIRHIVPLRDLILLTDGAEWVVDSGGVAGPITPATIDYRPQGYIGANNVQPVVTSKAVLYAQARGGRIREMLYSWQSQGYDTKDISIMAPHLFKGRSIVSMCYSHAPDQTLWAVRDDGILLGLTYVPEHEIAAWHKHDTDGYYEAVASVPEGEEDVVYAIIRRTINGRTVRNVERMHSRTFTALKDAFFVDCGITYDGAATTSITGLWHLEGEVVTILADGAVHPVQTVVAGAITLDNAASVVHIGLPYNADLQTLPMAIERAAGFGQLNQKNLNRVGVRVTESSGLFVGPSFTKLRENKQRTSEVYGTPPDLVTGMREVMVTPDWGNDAPICIRQSNPLPLTVTAIVPDTAYGG